MTKDFYLKQINRCEGFEALRIIADFARLDFSLCGEDYKEVSTTLYKKINGVNYKCPNKIKIKEEKKHGIK